MSQKIWRLASTINHIRLSSIFRVAILIGLTSLLPAAPVAALSPPASSFNDATLITLTTPVSTLPAVPSARITVATTHLMFQSNAAFIEIPLIISQAVQQPVKEADPWQLALHAGMRYVNLSWDDPCNNEQGFNIARSENGINWINIGSTRRNSTSFSDRGVQDRTNMFARIWAFLFGGLSRGSTYYYRVAAYNSEGIIMSSLESSISTK